MKHSPLRLVVLAALILPTALPAQDLGSVSVFVGNPNRGNSTAEAAFRARSAESRAAIGQGLTMLTGFVDYKVPLGRRWIDSANWWRTSMVASSPARTWIPVFSVGLADSVTSDPVAQMLAVGNPNDTVYGPVYQNIINGFRSSGFRTLYLRIGWEHNGEWYPWGTANADKTFNPQRAAAFVAAYRRVADIAHRTTGIRVLTVWSPNFERLTPQEVARTYPGDSYVDIIAPDMYSPVWNSIPENWDPAVTRTLSDAEWKNNLINRQHTWDYPAATRAQPTAGYGLVAMMQFALERNKPFGLGETGTDGGMSSGWYRGPEDRGDFPLYLTKRITEKMSQGLEFAYLGLWNSGSFRFTPNTRPLDLGAWTTLINTLAGADPIQAETVSVGSMRGAVKIVAGSGATGNYVPDPSRRYIRESDIGGRVSRFDANTVGDYIEYRVPVTAPGTYDIRLRVRFDYTRGMFRLHIDGRDLGVRDHFADAGYYAYLDYGTHTFSSAGTKTFRFTYTGLNARNSSGQKSLTIDSFDLTPHRHEAETLSVAAVSDGTTVLREPGMSHGSAERFDADAVGDAIEYLLPVVDAGTYAVRVGVKKFHTRGIFQLRIDGAARGVPQDLYVPHGAAQTLAELDLGNVTFTSTGNKVFRFTVTGRHAASSGYGLAIDYVALTRR